MTAVKSNLPKAAAKTAAVAERTRSAKTSLVNAELDKPVLAPAAAVNSSKSFKTKRSASPIAGSLKQMFRPGLPRRSRQR